MDALFHTLTSLNAPLGEGFFGCFPFSLTSGGVALFFYAPRHRIKLDRRIDAGVRSPNEARLHLDFLRLSAPVLTVLGCSVIGMKLYGL